MMIRRRNKKKKNIIAGVFIFTFITITLSVFANNNTTTNTNFTSIDTEIEKAILNSKNKGIMVVNGDTYKGNKYENYFECSPENGENLNINIKNATNGKLIFSIEGLEDKIIPPNAQLTRAFFNKDGINGKYKINVTAEDGNKIDIKVNARQF